MRSPLVGHVHVEPDDEQRDEGDRKVDEEQPAPGEVIGDEPARGRRDERHVQRSDERAEHQTGEHGHDASVDALIRGRAGRLGGDCGHDYLRYRLRGRPSTLSARMLRKTSDVPASIVFARERRNWYFQPSPSPTWAAGPAMSIAVSVIRWLSSDHMSLRIEPSGPGMPLRLTAVTVR